jgi:hypothetical protein
MRRAFRGVRRAVTRSGLKKLIQQGFVFAWISMDGRTVLIVVFLNTDRV